MSKLVVGAEPDELEAHLPAFSGTTALKFARIACWYLKLSDPAGGLLWRNVLPLNPATAVPKLNAWRRRSTWTGVPASTGIAPGPVTATLAGPRRKWLMYVFAAASAFVLLCVFTKLAELPPSLPTVLTDRLLTVNDR